MSLVLEVYNLSAPSRRMASSPSPPVRRSCRGQVAAEYLATYGWALFAMFVVMAVLISSGLLGPGRFSGEECLFVPNLPCTGFYAVKTANANEFELNFNLTNTQGFPVYIKNCAFRLRGGEYQQSGDPAVCGGYLPQGGSVQYSSILLQSTNKVTSNEMRTIFVTLSFKNCQDALGADQAAQAADCSTGDPNDARFPLHNTSGRLLVQVRG